jgi:hypothetical protein
MKKTSLNNMKILAEVNNVCKEDSLAFNLFSSDSKIIPAPNHCTV